MVKDFFRTDDFRDYKRQHSWLRMYIYRFETARELLDMCFKVDGFPAICKILDAEGHILKEGFNIEEFITADEFPMIHKLLATGGRLQAFLHADGRLNVYSDKIYPITAASTEFHKAVIRKINEALSVELRGLEAKGAEILRKHKERSAV